MRWLPPYQSISPSLYFSLCPSHTLPVSLSLSLSLPPSFFFSLLSSSISHSLNSILFISSQLAQPHLSAKLWEPLLDPTEVSIFTHEMYLFVSLIVGWCLLCAIRDDMKVPLYVHSAISIHLTLSHFFLFFLLSTTLITFTPFSSTSIFSNLLSLNFFSSTFFSSPLFNSSLYTVPWRLRRGDT